MNELRITVPLSRDEFIALRELASVQLRNPREQARYLLRDALGLAGETAKPTKNNRTAEPLAGQRSAVVTPIS